MSFAAGHSRSAIDRAGTALRDYWISGEVTDGAIDAFGVMIEFRETFQRPLDKTVLGLRSMVRSEWSQLKVPGTRLPVVQRLKRREQILRKLARLSESKLSNMGDIGGCRAVLRDRSQVDGVLRRIRKNWRVHGRVRDTRDEPASSGYRAVHVIVVRDDRRIEIQLRTPHEHAWAVAVERTGVRLGYGLKEGEGPADLLEYFRLASQGMYLESIGQSPEHAFLHDFEAAREKIRTYLPG
jgi:putative GTP pyrophosphokinase